MILSPLLLSFTDTAPTEIYTLSLHDALPISEPGRSGLITHVSADGAGWIAEVVATRCPAAVRCADPFHVPHRSRRSEEHTSELQSRRDLVCRLLLEKKKKKKKKRHEQLELVS